MFIQIFPACVIIHTLSSFPRHSALSFFPLVFWSFGSNNSSKHLPQCPQSHTFLFPLRRYLFLPCLLPAHSSQSLSPDISSHSLSSFTPRPLSNFPALSPIHLPICVPASLDPDNAHFLSLLFSLYPPIISQNFGYHLSSIIHSLIYSYMHIFACKSKYQPETNLRLNISVLPVDSAYV